MAKINNNKLSHNTTFGQNPKNDLSDKRGGAQSHSFPLIRKLCIALAVITMIAYVNTLQNGYVLDDIGVIKNNTLVKSGFAGIPELLITPRFKGFEHIVNDSYRPLSLVTFAIEYQLFGPNPTAGHFFNILFFAGCVILLFLFLNKLFNGQQTGIAFIAALLFALHPIHTEVVANIKSRDELLCFFFAFWSLIVFVNYSQNGKLRQLITGAFLLFFSFLSKETVIAFVFVIPLVFFFYQNGNKKRSTYVSIATLLVAAVFLGIKAWVLKANDNSAIPFLDNPLVHASLFSERIPTAIMVLGMYLKLLFVPYPLISDYSYSSIPLVSFGNIAVVISLIIYLFIAATGIYRLLKKPGDTLAFGILFFLATLALFSNIPFLVYSEMAERLAFFASAGFCIAIAALLWLLMAKAQPQNDTGIVPKKIWYVIAPVSIVFLLLTITRNADWKTNYTLTTIDVKKSPANARLWHSMGYLLLSTEVGEEPDLAGKQQMIKEGISDMQRSLSIYPYNAKAHQDLGNFFRDLQQYDSAEIHLKQAVILNPNSYVPVSDLGFVYFSEKKYSQALALSQTALLRDKKNTSIINNMAMCYLQMQKYDSAIIMAKQALAIDPQNKLSAEYIATANKAIGETTR